MVFALTSQQLWTAGRRKYSGPGPKRKAELELNKWVMEPGSAVSIDIMKGLKRTLPKEAKKRKLSQTGCFLSRVIALLKKSLQTDAKL